MKNANDLLELCKKKTKEELIEEILTRAISMSSLKLKLKQKEQIIKEMEQEIDERDKLIDKKDDEIHDLKISVRLDEIYRNSTIAGAMIEAIEMLQGKVDSKQPYHHRALRQFEQAITYNICKKIKDECEKHVMNGRLYYVIACSDFDKIEQGED